MKFTIALLFGLTCLLAIAIAKPAEEDYADYEEEPAPPPKPVARSPLIGRRNPLTARAGVSKATSTTPAPPPPKEEEIAEDEETEQELAEEPSSTTESPKKLKSGVVRPFRSNDELLAALKRRREQAVHNKANAKPVSDDDSHSESAPAPAAKATTRSHNLKGSNGRRRYNKQDDAPAAQDVQETSSTAAPSRAGRRFRN